MSDIADNQTGLKILKADKFAKLLPDEQLDEQSDQQKSKVQKFKREQYHLAQASDLMMRMVSENSAKIAKFFSKRARTIEAGYPTAVKSNLNPIMFSDFENTNLKNTINQLQPVETKDTTTNTSVSLFKRLREHRDNLFKSSYKGILDSFKVTNKHVPLFFDADGLVHFHKNHSYGSSMMAETMALASFARARLNDNQKNTKPYPLPLPLPLPLQTQATANVSVFGERLKNIVCNLSSAISISTKLYAESLTSSFKSIGRFFTKGSKTVLAGAQYAKHNPYKTLAACGVASLGLAFVGLNALGAHVDMSIIQDAISHTASAANHVAQAQIPVGQESIDLVGKATLEAFFQDSTTQVHTNLANMLSDHTSILAVSDHGDHLVQLASNTTTVSPSEITITAPIAPTPSLPTQPTHVVPLTNPVASDPHTISEQVTNAAQQNNILPTPPIPPAHVPADHVQSAVKSSVNRLAKIHEHTNIKPSGIKTTLASSNEIASKVGRVDQAGIYSTTHQYTRKALDNSAKALQAISENVQAQDGKRLVSSDFLDHMGKGTESASDFLNNISAKQHVANNPNIAHVGEKIAKAALEHKVPQITQEHLNSVQVLPNSAQTVQKPITPTNNYIVLQKQIPDTISSNLNTGTTQPPTNIIQPTKPANITLSNPVKVNAPVPANNFVPKPVNPINSSTPGLIDQSLLDQIQGFYRK